MLHSGITCYNDMYFTPDKTFEISIRKVCEIVKSIGIRARIGLCVMDLPTLDGQTAKEQMQV